MKKKKLIIIGIIIVLIIGTLMNCADDSKKEESNTSADKTTEENIAEEEKTILFEDDEEVNKFFVDYQNLSNTEFKDFSSSRKYKCYAENSGYEYEVGHYHNTETGEETVGIRISQTNDTADAGVPAMREAYYYTVKALNNTLSDEDIYNIFDNREEFKGENTLSNIRITITPDLELSGGHSRGTIDIEKVIE